MPQRTYTKNQINARIDSVLADNTGQDITASDVRSVVKDYMTTSFSAPLLIYSGQILAGADVAGSVVKDHYYNPDFFQVQQETNPTTSDNIYQLSTVSVPGTADGEYTIGNPTGKGDQLELKVTVASNLITKMEVISPGVGYILGDSWTTSIGSNTVTVTYNGVIRPVFVSSTGTYFTLTQNDDATEGRHSNVNTLISATPKSFSYSTSNSTGIRQTVKNEFLPVGESRCYFTNYHTYTNPSNDQATVDRHYQHIQLYRLPWCNKVRTGY